MILSIVIVSIIVQMLMILFSRAIIMTQVLFQYDGITTSFHVLTMQRLLILYQTQQSSGIVVKIHAIFQTQRILLER